MKQPSHSTSKSVGSASRRVWIAIPLHPARRRLTPSTCASLPKCSEVYSVRPCTAKSPRAAEPSKRRVNRAAQLNLAPASLALHSLYMLAFRESSDELHPPVTLVALPERASSAGIACFGLFLQASAHDFRLHRRYVTPCVGIVSMQQGPYYSFLLTIAPQLDVRPLEFS